MSDAGKIDTSREAVAKRLERLESLVERGWIDGDVVDLVSALSAALSEARGKVDELEALREQQAAAFVKFAKDRPVAPHPVDQMENLRRAMTTDIEIEKLEAERDSALDELAKLRAEAEWRPIESAPRDGTKVLVALHEFNDPANPYVSCFATFENGSWIEEGDPIYQPDYFFALPSPPKDPAHD
jgi:hypothetical protein